MLQRAVLKIFYHVVITSVITSLAIHKSLAEDAVDLPSILTVSAGMDSDEGSDFYLDANVALMDGQRLSLAAGKINLAPSDDTNSGLEPVNFLLGLSGKPDLQFPAGFEYEFWGEEGDITVESFRGTIGYNADNFSLSVTPQNREFELYLEDRDNVKFYSKGISFNADISAMDPWLVSLGYTKNDYDFALLEAIERFAQLVPRLSSANLPLLRNAHLIRRRLIILQYRLAVIRQRFIDVANLDDRIYHAGLTYLLNWGDLGAYWIRSRSVVKDTDTDQPLMSDSYGMTATFDISQDWSIGLQLSNQTVESADSSVTAGRISLSHYW